MIWICPACSRQSLPDGRQNCSCTVEDQEKAASKRSKEQVESDIRNYNERYTR